ncbi:hypothetical protein N657DRAFT_352293 [Parathielavia appendiculata]|uniref:Uncharacterized protein n=1 Tax=Parathielavia appendiculata TaxID=2587402 RepID=A0AAN6U337_9PEZI|nr:hypothetical protein N657DRAFT_352293 [Parathielavia appendiculata]
MASRIPHLLEPYLALPDEAAFLVLTGVLGASTNWLVLRHLYSLLKPSSPSHTSPARAAALPPPPPPQPSPSVTATEHNGNQDDVAVLLVSFLRDYAFWRENLSRLGVDLEAAARRGKFGYMDGLGWLFSSPSALTSSGQGQQQQQARGQGGGGWKRTLTSPAPGDISRVVMEGVEQLQRSNSNSITSPTGKDSELKGKKVVLVIDGLDLVLAASDPNAGAAAGQATALALKEMLMDLRETTHAAIITLAADDPLIKEQETTLEKQHAWFTLSLAHEADTMLSLRLLDTGAAKDVSGVIRITHKDGRARDHEYLYHVGGDGGVRVFERGQ